MKIEVTCVSISLHDSEFKICFRSKDDACSFAIQAKECHYTVGKTYTIVVAE